MGGVVDRAVPAGFSPPWEELYRSDYPKVVRLAGLLLGDYQAGEEIAQEAFARLMEARADVADPQAYLRGIVANLCRSQVRRAVLARRHRLTRADDVPGPEEAVGRIADRSAVRDALQRLPRRQREAVVFRFYGEMTEREVAAVMGVSVGSVKTHLHRAAAALSKQLEALR
jgi:RNA polymerase sigma factor (sigma-70 family)